jgi:hypothetical protein
MDMHDELVQVITYRPILRRVLQHKSRVQHLARLSGAVSYCKLYLVNETWERMPIGKTLDRSLLCRTCTQIAIGYHDLLEVGPDD